ncbi:MAG: alpha/beta hydrolase [Candidatus Heimdallarchaeota archaeon]|nr:alpha/beta hydrolase [Candidatus Heimdallarchaeota archaeon]MDH5645249.1 alpha/beta hydrolase [Candidatus Heimdallarchaeota archaeon]
MFIPPLIIGEIYYSASRHSEYPDLDGFQSTLIINQKGPNIQAWFTNTTNKIIIISHGHSDNSGLMKEWYSNLFIDMGYDLLIFDFRNHGRSDDMKPVSMGIKEAEDVAIVLNWISKYNWNKTILFGSSMGAISNLLAIDDLSIIDGLILDSIFLDFDKMIEYNQQKHNIPQLWRIISQYYLNKRVNIDHKPNILEKIVELSHIPILILHGTNDIESPINELEPIKTIQNQNLTFIEIQSGEHSRLFYHDLFHISILEFLNELV